MNLPPIGSGLTAIKIYEPDPHVLYSIETAAQMAHVPRRRIAIYYRKGLVAPVMDPETGGWQFNDEGIRRLRRIEQLRSACGMNLEAIQMILELMEEVSHLRQEIRSLRGG